MPMLKDGRVSIEMGSFFAGMMMSEGFDKEGVW